MATRLFFHDAVNALSGTFPTTEQSTVGTPTLVAPTANTLRTMDSITGSAMVTRSITASATTIQQIAFHGFFCSPPLDSNQLIPPQTTTLNIANRENSSSMNFGADLRAVAYVWRPSTGTLVGYITDGLVGAGDIEPAALSIRCNATSVTSTVTISCATGDVIICEVWNIFTEATANAFQAAFYYDGTTVNTVIGTASTSHASFYELATSSLTFMTPITGTFSNSLDAAVLSATGTAPHVGTFDNTLATVALSATGTAPHVGTFSNTLGAVTLSGVGAVPHTATFNNTLATVALSATGAVPEVGTFSNTLAALTLVGEGVQEAAPAAEGTFDNTLADVTLSGAGLVVSAAEGTFDNTLGVLSLSATGTGPIVMRPSDGGTGANASKRKKFAVPLEAELASPVDALFDHPPRPQAPPELSPTRVIHHDTLSLAEAVASVPPAVPVPKPVKITTIEPEIEEYSDEDMIILAMLA